MYTREPPGPPRENHYRTGEGYRVIVEEVSEFIEGRHLLGELKSITLTGLRILYDNGSFLGRGGGLYYSKNTRMDLTYQ